METGVTPLMYYDALGRLTKTEMPDGTFSKTVFGPWKQLHYDANDTVLDSRWYQDRVKGLIDAGLIAEGHDPVEERTAAEKAARHADTPEERCFDAHGPNGVVHRAQHATSARTRQKSTVPGCKWTSKAICAA